MPKIFDSTIPICYNGFGNRTRDFALKEGNGIKDGILTLPSFFLIRYQSVTVRMWVP